MDNIAGVILAGGKSSRMGRDKAQIAYRELTLLDHMENLLRSVGINNIYISRQDRIKDIVPDCGPLGGIYSVMHEISEAEMVIVPVDMPLLSKEIITKLVSSDYSDAAIFSGYNMPLKIRVSESIKNKIGGRILGSKKSLSIRMLLHELEVKYLNPEDCNGQCFINVNTLIELESIS